MKTLLFIPNNSLTHLVSYLVHTPNSYLLNAIDLQLNNLIPIAIAHNAFSYQTTQLT